MCRRLQRHSTLSETKWDCNDRTFATRWRQGQGNGDYYQDMTTTDATVYTYGVDCSVGTDRMNFPNRSGYHNDCSLYTASAFNGTLDGVTDVAFKKHGQSETQYGFFFIFPLLS